MFDYISLFTGIGGFDLACDAAGMNCIGHAENDKSASAVLKRHWPNVTNYGDVRNVKKENIQRSRTIDLICGGFPCQDLSVAGERAGLAGKRSGLWYEFARIIDEFEPRWVVAENVPGLLSSDGGRDFAIILSWLVKRGYGVCWRVLDAQYFGLAQRRKRVFIVASFGNGRCAEVLFERESLLGDPAQGRKTGQELADTLTKSAGERGESHLGGGNDSMPHNVFPVSKALNVKGGSGRIDAESETFVAYTVNFADTGGSRPDRPNGGLYVKETKTSDALTGSGSIVHVVTPPPTVTAFMAGQGAEARSLAISKDVSPTLKGSPSGTNQAPTIAQNNYQGVRRLTPTECERLQGFPDGWTDGQADSPRYRQLGNAVAVPVLTWIMKRIMQADQLP